MSRGRRSGSLARIEDTMARSLRTDPVDDVRPVGPDEGYYRCKCCGEDMAPGETVLVIRAPAAHLCCSSPLPFRGWFAGLPVEPPRVEPPPGVFPMERVMARWGIPDLHVLAEAARHLLLTVYPIRPSLHATGPATPYLRPTTPRAMEREVAKIRAEVTLRRIMAFPLG